MICKLCGREAADDALYCTGCGNSFQTEEQTMTEQLAMEQDNENMQPEQLTFEQGLPGYVDVEPVYPEPMPVKIKSHMVLAIVTTVLFFNWMLGIPAIVFARECELAAERGMVEIAMRFSRRAVTFALVGVALNIAVVSFLALVIVVMSAAGPFIFY